jgi:acetyl-CoA carboxylase carboxyltransferase component
MIRARGEPDAPHRGPYALLERICDPGSLALIRTRARSRRLPSPAPPGDGVLGGTGEINGRPVVCYAQDSGFLGGSLGEVHAETILHVLRLAGDARVPVIGCVASAGARLHEGVAALHGYGTIFNAQVRLGGQVPQITYVGGTAAGGGAYSPSLADFVIMRRDASMFLTGPKVVRQVCGEDLTASELGGVRVHSRSGVAHLIAENDEDAASLIRRLLSYLPQEAAQLPPWLPPRACPPGRVSDLVPIESRRVYDMRDVIRALMDGGELLELAPRWAPNMVCAFARLDGRSVGVVANQPRRLGGTINAAASEKATRFISTCASFRLPLVVLVDTPGFLPGRREEQRAVLRAGASLIRAFTQANVPRVTVIVRKAYGGAYITMNSKSLGAQLTFAWPRAEIGVMGAQEAVRITHHDELSHAEDSDHTLLRLSRDYAERHLGAEAAAYEGFIDEVVEPEATRERLSGALRLLAPRPRLDEQLGSIVATEPTLQEARRSRPPAQSFAEPVAPPTR